MSLQWARNGDNDAQTDGAGTSTPARPDLVVKCSSRTDEVSIGQSVESTPARRPRFWARCKSVSTGILRIFVIFPYHDPTLWVGFAYFWGSVLFVIGGFLALYSYETYLKNSKMAGVFACMVAMWILTGMLLYQVGSTAAWFAVINKKYLPRAHMRRLWEAHRRGGLRGSPEEFCELLGHAISCPKLNRTNPRIDSLDTEAGWMAEKIQRCTCNEIPSWQYCPSWHDLRTDLSRDIACIACGIQGFGVTLFGVTGVYMVIGVFGGFEVTDHDLAIGYFIPQMTASVCFLIANVLYLWEAQKAWYKPNHNAFGWWIAFFAVIGSIGFLLCAIFGYHEIDLLQSILAGTWGATAFAISSGIHMYEVGVKHADEQAKLSKINSRI